MSISLITASGAVGMPSVGWEPVGNSITSLKGDMYGLTTGGLVKRLGSGELTSGGGIWGFGVNDWTSDSSGNIINASAPPGVDPSVPAQLALSSYNRRVRPNQPISGVSRGMAEYWSADPRNVFIQRHKVGTRVNASLCGKKCDLVWNSTTLEWEVDTTATSVNCIVIAEARFQAPLYKDNKTYWDSSTFATDAKAAWIAFQIVPAYYAEALGLRY